MLKEDGLKKRRTRHILQDLLSSTVRLKRPNYVPRSHGRVKKLSCEENEENPVSPEVTSCCSVCSESGTNLRPLAVQEMEILAKFVLSQEQIALILQTEDHPPIFCCKICSSAILSLAKLSMEIENITLSIRAVISRRNGLFNKLRKESGKIPDLSGGIRTEESSQISELSPAENSCRFEENLPAPNDQEQLTLEQDDRISVKSEPIADDDDDDQDLEITPDLDSDYQPEKDVSPETGQIADDDDDLAPEIAPDSDYEPDNAETSGEEESDDDDDYGANVSKSKSKKSKSEVEDDIEAKLVCDLCQPIVTFTRYDTLRRHVMNNKIHKNLKQEDYMPTLIAAKQKKKLVLRHERRFPCDKCDKRFSSKDGVYRHNRTVHDGVRYRRKCDLCPAAYYDTRTFYNHMLKSHKIPIPAKYREKQFFSHSCDMCEKTFTMKTNMHRHVELVHFPDKTSCPYGCKSKIDSEAEWLQHLEVCESPKITAESACVCNHCNAVSRNVLLRMEHYFREHEDKLYTCALCGGRFTVRDVLYNHICTANAAGNLGLTRRDNYSCNMLLQNTSDSSEK